MERYPRHCVARPDVFEFPWTVVRPESILVPGKVFYLVPYHTIYIPLKSKRQQLESLDPSTEQKQSAKQQERYYRRQTYHHDNNISAVNDLESYCNDSGNLYKLSLYKSWNWMRIILQHIHQGTYGELYDSSQSCFNLTRTGQTNFAKTEHLEFPRVKSCLRNAASEQKKIDLRVSFASPVVVLGSWRGSPSVSRDDLALQV
ncbi:hypothetical protein CDL12_19202 [Handroanthus impetiginosus]|uniref:Uncharacterized protein n=1 Tax=Handroanthus impetiginosus TaxID=429701 RepID=A0A2G9GSF7_9LAMI|nr:hypothetical protein CDL12_19202 [Handroanthus impetiginosus]